MGAILEYIIKGGVEIMVPLLLLFLIAIAYTFERFFHLTKAKINTAEFLTKVRHALRNKNVKEAVKICETFKGPIASILKTGLMKYGSPQEEIEKTMENAAMHEIARLERGLPVLSTISNLAPILGFLGTVTGMIASFDALAQLNDPGAVAQGISQALITTAGGLIVSVPALLAYSYFTTRVNSFIREIESASAVLMEAFSQMDREF
ncbi:MotA/TolQ/ExbB proton channel family protein [Sulfidibacter corallicola]|uniref:MotA/TolQ/ExbB proton channel family protein n=1 Tax=Sulfidibacter corallicola TaxID=2818388 RepID=A0A8A4TUT8_SULCO|nr:MotA/TolQ/ExbB proton channel family protein [Sulfidibacter corallicola]QTD53280.1 MotA/TolQ/ExbB proton channel family protein [Sulfidibacter corallicola]